MIHLKVENLFSKKKKEKKRKRRTMKMWHFVLELDKLAIPDSLVSDCERNQKG